MEWGNIAAWLGGGTRNSELDETRIKWRETEAAWAASPLATDRDNLSLRIMRNVMRVSDAIPAVPLLVAGDVAADVLLWNEQIGPIEPDWAVIDADVSVAVEVRKLLTHRKRWSVEFDRLFAVFERRITDTYLALFRALPDACFERWMNDDEDALGVPLIELVDQPAEMVQRFTLLPYDDDAMQLGLFERLRSCLATNLLVASGFPPQTDIFSVADRLVIPTKLRAKKSPSELVELYLGGTPFEELLQVPVPFAVPEPLRFEHCHIIGGTGHGKTQLLQRFIFSDLVAAQRDGRSVIVIDSQGDLINKLVRLDLFSPDADDSLADRLVLVDPADIEFPTALNLFDPHLERAEDYSPVDRERVLNGVVELYETFFGAMLGAELTQKQGVIFRYLARLMITIPGATIHTLMQIMEDATPWKAHMARLDGSARHFFETEFFAPSFAATKKQILRRLWGVLSTPAFERMFGQRENKLDLYEAMNAGKIILVSTAKDLLKADGSALLGRFFISMIAQAALERSVIDPDDRTPTFVYVDEAQEYFGDDVETILNQARKYRVGLTLAHQTLDQLTPRLRSVLHANTSLKFAGGVSARDARAIAEELHTTSEFVEGMRRRRDRTEFAAWLKNVTPNAIRLSAPLGFLERQPTSTEPAFERLLAGNRERYGGTYTPFEMRPPPVAQPEPKPVEEHSPKPSEAPRERDRQPEQAAQPSSGLGKGGRQHKYLQTLVKELGEQQGFRATIEAPIPGGQIDVLLQRGAYRVGFEVAVTTPSEHERRNIEKCLNAGVDQVAAVLVKSPGVRARFRDVILAELADDDAAKVTCLAPEELPDFIAGLGTPDEGERLVKGYRVTVSRRSTTAEEAKLRREAITRVVARSLAKGSD